MDQGGVDELAADPEGLARLHDTARTGFRLIALRLSTSGVGFVASIFIARGLGPRGRGEYALPVAIAGIAVALSHVGLEHANIFLASRKMSLRTLWANATFVGVVAGVAACLTLIVASLAAGPQMFGGLPDSWIAVAALQVPILLLTLYWVGLLQLDGRLVAASRARLAGAVVLAGLSGLLLLAELATPFRALIAWGVATVVVWLILLILCARSGLAGRELDWSAIRRGLTFGLKTYIGVTLFFLLLRIDQLLVAGFLGLRAVGIYSLAVVLAEFLWLFTESFAAALLHHQVRAEEGAERRLGDATARMSLLVSLGVAILAWVAAPIAVRLAYGTEFEDVVWPFRLLLPGVVALSVQRPMGAVIVKEGRVWLVSVFGAGAVAVNLAANVVLLPWIGVEGASIASALSYAGLAFLYVAATRRRGVARWRDLRPRLADARRLWGGLVDR